jgi:hypothetical protein
MKNLFLLLTFIFSVNAYSDKISSIWELELRTQDETTRIVIELTDEEGDSCLFGNPKKVKTIEGKLPTGKYFSGYSYSIDGGMLSIDMFPLLCDGGDILHGKIEGNTVSGEIYSSSIAGLKKVGSFNGKSTQKKP